MPYFSYYELTLNVIYVCVVCVVQQLRMKAKSEVGPMSVARLPINQGRNRYRDVLPGMRRMRGRHVEVGGRGWQEYCCVWASRLTCAYFCLVCAMYIEREGGFGGHGMHAPC